MNKTAIKHFAIQSRIDLIKGVTQKAFEIGVTEEGTTNRTVTSSDALIVNGQLLDAKTKKQREALLSEISTKGFKQVMEEVAYTWFNRFIALRFMEVNGYLPSRIRVFTNNDNEFRPEILAEALYLPFENIDKEKVITLYSQNKNEELYKYLLISQCNDLNNSLPDMFERIENYTELLFPEGLLTNDSILANMIHDIPKEDWKDQVEIIGWLYQYYNEEIKNQVINIYKGTVKKYDIPAATQLFTTDWVVRYMVDNSLGRYWIERNPKSKLKSHLSFYLDSKDKDQEYINDQILPENIKFFDPCMGSGHILVYAFEVLMEIYLENGYDQREAAKLILERNLYGLDIDGRAYQLAYFAVMMKARSYNRLLFSYGIKPNLASLEETNEFENFEVNGPIELDPTYVKIANTLISTFKDAKEIGSIQIVPKSDYDGLVKYIFSLKNTCSTDLFLEKWYEKTIEKTEKLVFQARILTGKYQVVVTNPPYLNKIEGPLKKYILDKYNDYAGDLFSVFIYRNFEFCTADGYSAFMTPFVWMFIKTYEKLRNYIIRNKSISSLIQMEYSAFEEATVPICTFVLKNCSSNFGLYIKLSEFKGGMDVQKNKVIEAIREKPCTYFYESELCNFSKIPGNPIAFWASSEIIKVFENAQSLINVADVKKGLDTGNNEKFLRLWYEVSLLNTFFGCSDRETAKLSNRKWFPCNKGGSFRKWYGNNEYVIDWENDGYNMKQIGRASIRSPQYYFKEGITWSTISSSFLGMRFSPVGSIFETAGNMLFVKNHVFYCLGFLCGKLPSIFIECLNPTITTTVGSISLLPILIDNTKIGEIEELVKKNIDIEKNEWDSYEISWDFKTHPLLKQNETINFKSRLISESYIKWEVHSDKQFYQLKISEEELNIIFIEMYGFKDKIQPNIEETTITVRKANIQRDIKSLVSYSVGCMFGRYSLDIDGLTYAGGDWNMQKYKTYIPDADNIIPISDDDYFDDDIVSRFTKFISVVYGDETLEENLNFIANALSIKGNNSREIIRNYFLNEFYLNHLKIYQKHPIYWLFDSGKENGFKSLIYMHRYQSDLLSTMRVEYVHEQQERYRTQLSHLEDSLVSILQIDKIKVNKRIETLRKQSQELKVYEEKLQHYADQKIEIELDDGVVVNYAKFGDLVSKIK